MVKTLKYALNCKKLVESQTDYRTVSHSACCFCGGNVSFIGDKRRSKASTAVSDICGYSGHSQQTFGRSPFNIMQGSCSWSRHFNTLCFCLKFHTRMPDKHVTSLFLLLVSARQHTAVLKESVAGRAFIHSRQD